MTNLSFAQLDDFFRKDDFLSIEKDNRGTRFLKLRSMSRSKAMKEFCTVHNIDISTLQSRQYFPHIFELANITDEHINAFINQKYQEERLGRLQNEEHLVDQLSRLQHFDWGGSFGNSLEKNIVDNYVKKIQSFDRISEEIEGSILTSLKGYTLNSWYNHWTSILIEDLFKDHPNVLPTVGLVKKIDFFIQNIPFDLKVTYFPEQLLIEKLRIRGYGNEITKLKQICRKLNILIPNDLKDRALKLHLYNKVNEDQRDEAKQFIAELKLQKREIISEAEANPEELKIWFYENQGEARFDASNRFFLVLTDETDISNSWKLKRNIVFLRQKINEHLDTITIDLDRLNTEFFWNKTQQIFHCKSDILFVKQTQ
ncbi:hypothetical protein [Pedobacter alluvionis]|uniref:Uncharacterized protein n=1 Tax=Pedobacter alluvionis TaxID=475253 RepID=A0A497Y9A6_9SPHI|nr:hypothetical protein [Pedobacter alluvionis]RLJ79805.1 hypothetical protein BCL90_0515 [Pedobacter alluvionis]TFB31119.1 hypothetical protein E3V97_10920 [Pedobacter alluvionis]